MQNWKEWWLKLPIRVALLLSGFIIVERLCHTVTDGFSMRRIYCPFQTEERFHPKPPQLGVCQILSQPFHYLDSGSQSFVFLSADKRYVLKFFKLKTGYWKIPSAKREKSFVEAFDSCLIHAQQFRQESGVLYCHLKPSEHPLPNVELVDSCHKHLSLAINEVPFVVQRYVEPTSKRLLHLQDLQDTRRMKRSIDQLFEMLVKRYHLGLSDKDPNLIKNFGFMGEKVMTIDVSGLVVHRENLTNYFYETELIDARDKTIRWLKKNNPELVSYVEKKVTDIIEQRS